jgi:hypothetical protein
MINNEWHWSVSEYEPEENQEEERCQQGVRTQDAGLGTRSLLRAHAHAALMSRSRSALIPLPSLT